jgi:replicative DNA helicase Mcm
LTQTPLDSSIEHRLNELSKDPELTKKLVKSYAPNICRLERIKLALLYHLVGGTPNQGRIESRGAIHVLIIGDPGTGKTQLLQFTETLCDSVLVTGTGVNKDGLSALITLDNQGKPRLFGGALVRADQRFLHIDKFNKMNPEQRAIIETAMEQQNYPIALSGVVTNLNTRVSILAVANPSLGRYNPYKTLAQNINLSVGILSCFDLIFIIRDKADREKDTAIAEKMLKINKEESKDMQVVDHTLLMAYISKAAKINPVLTYEAKTMLKDFYLDIRRASEESGAISITPRQLSSLIRLAEANAKLHLREIVTESDVEASISLFSESLEQVGVDPVTRHYDIDVLYTGRPTVLNSKLIKVVVAFSELEKLSAIVCEKDLHNILFERHGMSRRTVARLLRTLIREEIIENPSPGYYKRKG